MYLAFSYEYRVLNEKGIAVMNLKTREKRLLALNMTYPCLQPTWHPDGENIIFTSLNDTTNFDVYSVNIKTGVILPLLQTPYDEYWASYSPHGKYLLSQRNQGEKAYIWVKDLSNGEELYYSTVIPASYTDRPRWTPDGNYITLLTHRHKMEAENFKVIQLPFDETIFLK